MRQHVTSFLNDTSYIHRKKTTVTVQPSTESPLLESVIKPEKVATPPPSASEGKQHCELPVHLVGLPPQVVRVAQMEADHVKSSDTKSPPLQTPVASHNYQIQQGYANHSGSSLVNADQLHGSAYQRHTVRHSGDQSVIHSDANHSHAIQPPVSSRGYQQQPVHGAGMNVGQSQSAPNLLAHPPPAEYVFWNSIQIFIQILTINVILLCSMIRF